MKELLNKLIEKGWKPFGDNAIKFDYDWMKTNCCWYWAITYKYRDSYIDEYWEEKEYEEWKHQFNNRLLVSRESWLWQFVCENGMVTKEYDYNDRTKNYDAYYNESDDTYSWDDYEYRIIESALCDEDKLEEFLLSNIKIDENKKENTKDN